MERTSGAAISVWALCMLGAAACASPMSPTDALDDVRTDSAVFDASFDGPADSAADAMPDTVAVDAHDGAPAMFDDPFVTQRRNCQFHAGAHVADTLGFTDADRAVLPIAPADIHIVILIQENRSFDHYFGRLARSDVDGTPPGYSNPNGTGTTVPTHAPTTCIADQAHNWDAMHAMWDMGRMDGFANNGGVRSLYYYDASDLPFYYWLYDTFAISDRFFSSVLGPTWPNRDYLYAATSAGVMNTNSTIINVRTVFDQLLDAGITWGVYYDGWNPEGCATGNTHLVQQVQAHHENSATFRMQATMGTLPQVSFIDGTSNTEDEHPASDVSSAEHWVHDLYLAVRNGRGWANTVMFFTYDEAGGFFDHVPPPEACVPDGSAANAEFNRLGIRVPLVAISPYARRRFVSHSQHQTTSILRFIQLMFDLPALSNRDANSDAMLDLFDFSTPALMNAPAPANAGMTRACP